jgi:hypothetical protein
VGGSLSGSEDRPGVEWEMYSTCGLEDSPTFGVDRGMEIWLYRINIVSYALHFFLPFAGFLERQLC